jgi:hypothetical protein
MLECKVGLRACLLHNMSAHDTDEKLLVIIVSLHVPPRIRMILHCPWSDM